MHNPENAFHLAIPSHNLDAAHDFYINLLGCGMGRRYDDHLTLNFFGAQLVCHLAPERIDPDPQMYPRHFGLTLRQRKDFDAMLERARASGASFYREPFVRFEGRPEEHWTFFLQDPSNNLIEFKFYLDSKMMH